MMKQIVPILVSAGLVIIFASCTRETVSEESDSSAPAVNAAPIQLDASIAQAAAEHKIILLDFTGSDWCPPCKQLHHDVLAQPEFAAYAESNLVFLTVDFPKGHKLSPDSAATNNWLAKKFSVDGFPTLIALDGHGNQIWQQVGYDGAGNPKGFIATIDAVKAKAK